MNIKSPYYAVIFTSLLNDDHEGYFEVAKQMEELAHSQEGFLGIKSVRANEGEGITVSYWKSLDAIKQWKAHSEHRLAQEKGKSNWYSWYKVEICKVEQVYELS